MDVIGVYAAGVKEVVASCGTALTDGAGADHASPRRHGGGEFRSRYGGRERRRESASSFCWTKACTCACVALDGGLDPDEY